MSQQANQMAMLSEEIKNAACVQCKGFVDCFSKGLGDVSEFLGFIFATMVMLIIVGVVICGVVKIMRLENDQ